jgi:hypothetical protein
MVMFFKKAITLATALSLLLPSLTLVAPSDEVSAAQSSLTFGRVGTQPPVTRAWGVFPQWQIGNKTVYYWIDWNVDLNYYTWSFDSSQVRYVNNGPGNYLNVLSCPSSGGVVFDSLLYNKAVYYQPNCRYRYANTLHYGRDKVNGGYVPIIYLDSANDYVIGFIDSNCLR